MNLCWYEWLLRLQDFLQGAFIRFFPLSSNVNGSPCVIPKYPPAIVAMENALEVMGKHLNRGFVRSPLPLLIAGWVFCSIRFHSNIYPQPTGILRWTFPCQNSYNQRSMWPNPNFCCLFISCFHGENPPHSSQIFRPKCPSLFLDFFPMINGSLSPELRPLDNIIPWKGQDLIATTFLGHWILGARPEIFLVEICRNDVCTWKCSSSDVSGYISQ